MLSITPDFNLNDLENDINQFVDEVEHRLIDALKRTGKTLVDKARARTKAENGFGNITWNLRSSIGCVIVKDHVIIDTYFPPIADGAEGHQTGIDYAKEIALMVDDGDIMLVFVAGMDYAFFVETKGYDVISLSSLKFDTEFNALINS